MGAFGSWDLGVKFAIVLGSLIALTFIAGFIKLWVNGRRLKRNIKLANEEAVKKKTDEEKLVGGRELDEGDLFGVRAIEHGYFGGVSQSRPSSPSPSYIMSPNTTVTDWSKLGTVDRNSAASSTLGSPSRNPSMASLAVPGSPDPSGKPKPSPLRLQASDAELNGKKTLDPASIGGMGGVYLPPLPSPRSPLSNRSVSPGVESTKSEGWVNPLDVHYSRPSTPKSGSRPASYLPKLNFPNEKSGLFVSTQNGGVKSEAASFVSTDKEDSASSTEGQKSPAGFQFFSAQPPTIPSRAARGSGRSMFPSDDCERPSSSRRSFKDATPPVPLANLSPKSATFDQAHFPQDTRAWGPSSPVIRDSVVSKKHVSVYRPSHREEPIPATELVPTRVHSVAASSMYSTRTSIVSEDASATNPTSRDRSTSSSRSITRTQDSVKRHSRNASSRDSKVARRRSRERDQIHFDPRALAHNRTISGGVQGRTINFDQPRESPFSNDNAVSRDHSMKSSIDSTSSSSSHGGFEQQDVRGRQGSLAEMKVNHDPMPAPIIPQLQIDTPDASRLSVNPMTGGGRNRSGSAASQVSIGDFYDAYYRQSIMAQRASQLNPGVGGGVENGRLSTNMTVDGRLSVGQGFGIGIANGNGRNVNGLRVGGLGLAGQTIEEVNSPIPSPVPSFVTGVEDRLSKREENGGGEDRFPRMI